MLQEVLLAEDSRYGHSTRCRQKWSLTNTSCGWEAKKKQHVIQLKELKLRSKIEEHDFQFKVRHVRKFLEKLSRVKLTMVFRGREVVHKELGERVLNRMFGEVSDLAVQEGPIKMEGRNMIMILSPKITTWTRIER